MTGQRFEFTPLADYHQQGAVKLEVEKLSKHGQFDDISFQVRAGEIVSITGLLGAGRTELCMALFGMTQSDSGVIRINGQPTTFKSNRDAISQGIGYVSEDRMSTGLVMEQAIQDNITASVMHRLKKPLVFLTI